MVECKNYTSNQQNICFQMIIQHNLLLRNIFDCWKYYSKSHNIGYQLAVNSYLRLGREKYFKIFLKSILNENTFSMTASFA